MKALLALLAALGLYTMAGSSSKSLARTATVDGRSYTIFSLGNGEYQVTSNANPRTWVGFNATHEIDQSGAADDLAVLRADMRRFPESLFK